MENNAHVHYQLTLTDPFAHAIDVTMTVVGANAKGQMLELPTWIPGSYLIREFAKHLVAIDAVYLQPLQAGPVSSIHPLHAIAGIAKEAFHPAQPLALEKRDKSHWQLAEFPAGAYLQIRYRVYAFDLSVRGAYLDGERAFFNPSSLCFAVVGLATVPHTLTIAAPNGASYIDWRVATAMPRLPTTNAWAFGDYQAPNYHALIDYPFACGIFELRSFSACGVIHHIAVSGHHHGCLVRLVDDLQRICETQIRFFSDAAPFEEYLFLLHVVGDGYGGLEHRNSTALLASRTDLPARSEPSEPSVGYRRLLALCSHEYFHSWNVKRIQPAVFSEADLSNEAYTRLLWAFEGITNYYDDLLLVRSGVMSESSYLETIAQRMSQLLRAPGHRQQSLADASFDTWIKAYRPDENNQNACTSYYSKGSLLAMHLDLTLREQSACTLDAVMRQLWQQFGFEAAPRVCENDWERVCQAVAGIDLGTFFDLHVRTPSDIVNPLLSQLARFGVTVQRRYPKDAADLGGAVLIPPVSAKNTLGAMVQSDPLGVRLTTVFSEGPAEKAGLAAGDVLIALDGLRLTISSLEALLSRLAPNASVCVHAFRRDVLLSLTIPLQLANPDVIGLAIHTDAPLPAAQRRHHWLHDTEIRPT